MPENIFGIKSILTASTMTIGEFLTCILCSTLLGFLISLIYIFTHRKTGYSQSYVLTMTMLPAIIAVIILIIGCGSEALPATPRTLLMCSLQWRWVCAAVWDISAAHSCSSCCWVLSCSC